MTYKCCSAAEFKATEIVKLCKTKLDKIKEEREEHKKYLFDYLTKSHRWLFIFKKQNDPEIINELLDGLPEKYYTFLHDYYPWKSELETHPSLFKNEEEKQIKKLLLLSENKTGMIYVSSDDYSLLKG